MTTGSRLKGGARRARAVARRGAKAALGRVAPNGSAASGPNASAAAIPDELLWSLPELYADRFALPSLSYGTVRDYADSIDNLAGLAFANADMKNLQRCWMVKALLGNVARGSRLVEIGAGEPLVAGVLSRLGYRVTVVDPYDGSGNGPREYAQFAAAYPDVRFVRDQFPPAAGLESACDCVYSISVLEHIPIDQIDGVISGARELLAQTGGASIHAIDHVLAGWSADSHREGLERIVAASGIGEQQLAETIAEMEGDPDTYFVSAESHNQWRGALEYDAYPMRRIGSVNLFATGA